MARRSRRSSHQSNRRLVVRVELMGAESPIWRRLEIAPELRLDQVHHVLQEAFEWEDAHLHQFEQRGAPEKTQSGGFRRTGRRFGMEFDDDWADLDDGAEPETSVTIGELLVNPKDELYYLYDFGDSWEHLIKLEETMKVASNAPLARFVDGRRASPPEDSGGVVGYEWALATSQDPSDPSYEEAVEKMEWMFDDDDFDPEVFDKEAISMAVKESV